MSLDEALELRRLLAAFLPIQDDLPWPVIHALNVSEDALHLRVIQRSVLLLGAALEGLIRTSKAQVTKQFRVRLPLLAAELGVEGVTEELADELYDARSEAAHGAPVTMFRVLPPPDDQEPQTPESPAPDVGALDAEAAEKWARAQELLRNAVRKAIEDDTFREFLATRDAIRTRWVVEHQGVAL